MNKKALVLIFLLGITIIPQISLAVTIDSIFASIAQKVWLVALSIIVICWIITGILFLTALGDPSKLSTAKTALFMAIAGTIIVVLAYSAISIIGNLIGV